MKKLNFILFILCSTIVTAQTLKVTADKNPAIVGEQILLQFTIDSESESFKSPKFKNLQVLSGPNSSSQSSYTFSNGKSQSNTSTTYSFYLKALSKGVFTIPSASVEVKGKTIKSKDFTIKIVDGNKKSKNQKNTISNNLFVKVETSKKNIVVGEQILVTYKLFTRVELQNTELSSLPNLNGFWVKDLETSSRFKREIIDGTPYNVAVLKKSVLTAQQSGVLIIDPIELKCSIRTQRSRNNRDPFANFFGNGYNLQEEFIKSKILKIKVAELNNAPEKFEGIVGDLNIISEIDNSNVNANNAINYKITITGKGNLELLNPLKIDFSEDFEVYEPKINNRIFEGGLKRSIKTFEYLIIPRYKGEYVIPPASLIVYNPKNKRFENKTSSKHKILVNASSNIEDENSIIIQQVIENDKDEINYIFTKTNLKKIGEYSIDKNIFYLLFLLPLFFILGFKTYAWLFKSDYIKKNNLKNKKAVKIAQKRLKNAQKCINNEDFNQFFEEIEKSLWGYFADKFKVKSADLSKETVSDFFENSEIANELENKFISLINECEIVRYSPSSNKHLQMDSFLIKAKNIIIEVENSLR